MTKKVLDNKCPTCAAPIFFNPTLGKWKCDYCDNEFTLEEMQKFNNASNQKYNEQVEEDSSVKKDETTYVSYNCQNCGAEIIADEQTAATFCVYCGNTAILKNKLSGEFAPSKIIPFKKEKQFAIDSFKMLSKGRPLMPKEFNNTKNIEKITGVYIPFWLFDINVGGSVNANAKKITSWSVGNTHYTKTDTYKLYRTAKMDYDRIPVDGSTRFTNDIMNTIEPFDYRELLDYNHAYLSGFLAEKYDVLSNDAFKEAGARAIRSTQDAMLIDMGNYSSKIVFENTLVAKQTKSEYALLPVWMVNVKYNGKYYLFAMNGQTGEFIGDIPIDKRKAFLYAIGIFAGTFLVVVIISLIIHFFGG